MLWNSEKRVLLYTKKLNSFYLVQHFWLRIRSYIMVLLCENKENNTHTHIHTHTHVLTPENTSQQEVICLARAWDMYYYCHHHHHQFLNRKGCWGSTDNFTSRFHQFSCSPLPSGTCWTPGLSIPWCCLPTSSLLLYKIDNLQLMMGLVMRQGWV